MYIVESECIYCGACLIECPESAVISTGEIYMQGSSEQKEQKPEILSFLSEKGKLNIKYAINSEICTRCPDQDLPLCYSICPMNSIKIEER